MTWDSPTTFCLNLDGLDADRATFAHYMGAESTPSGLILVDLSREVWQEMGRPSHIKVTPEVVR
jgi:hypothetical protein